MAQTNAQMAIVAAFTDNATGGIRRLQGAIQTTGAKTEGLTGSILKANAIMRVFDTVVNLAAKSVEVLVGAMVRFTSDSLKFFGDFEQGALGMARTIDGATKESTIALSEALLQIETPTAIEELQDIGRIAGAMGVAEDGVLDFVEAIDQVNVALGDEFTGGAEEITMALGTIGNAFGLVDDKGRLTADGMTKVGSAINTLGAEGLASGPFLADFAQRLGGIAPLAGMSITDVLGLGAAMQELGQSQEVAGTAMSKLLQVMGTDLPTFAEIAGINVKEFSKLFEEDANEAMLVFAEGLAEQEGGFENLSKLLDDMGLSGGRMSGVLGVLAENTDLVRKRQDLASESFEEGTSIIEEFNKMLDSQDFKTASVTKKIQLLQVAFAKALQPALTEIFDAFMPIIKDALPSIQQGFENITPKITAFVQDVLPPLLSKGKEVFEDVKKFAEGFFSEMERHWPKLVDMWNNGVAPALEEVKQQLDKLFGEDVMSKGKLLGTVFTILGGLIIGFITNLASVAAGVLTVVNGIVDIFLFLQGSSQAIFNEIAGIIETFVNSFVDAYNAIAEVVPGMEEINRISLQRMGEDTMDLSSKIDTMRNNVDQTALQVGIDTNAMSASWAGSTAASSTAILGLEGQMATTRKTISNDLGEVGQKSVNMANVSSGAMSNASGAAKTFGSQASTGLKQAQDAAGSAGGGMIDFGNNTAAGMQNADSQVTRMKAGAADKLSSLGGQSGGWGAHLGQNFASGIRGTVGDAIAAAQAVASAVAGILQHTTPKYGPLSDDDVWGDHMIENFARGMRRKRKLVEHEAMETGNMLRERMREKLSFSGESITNNNHVNQSNTFNVRGNNANDIIEQINKHLAERNQATNLGLNTGI